MATQVKRQSNGFPEKVQGAADGILASIHGYAHETASQGQVLLDRTFPPEQRSAASEKLQAFISTNPKLSTFLGINLLLTGLPLAFFLLFTATVTLSSLIIGLLLGLLGAVLFILMAVGTALCVLLPTIFFTTTCACLLFLWVLSGYYILNWANGGKGTQGAADKLNALVGGRLSGFTDQMNSRKSVGGYSGNSSAPRIEDTPYGQVDDTVGSATSKQDPFITQKGNRGTGIDSVSTTGLGATSTI